MVSGDNPEPVPALEEIIAESGVPYPNGHPYSHITFAMVAWNEGARLDGLLASVRPFFTRMVVGVQKSDDDTLEIARKYADVVVEDEHRGYGDATFGPLVLPQVRSPWTLKIDADEMPSPDLLDSLSNATWWADHHVHTKGVWIPFHSSVEDNEYEEQHAHLRLFHTDVGWPRTMHSRPNVQDGVLWQTGYVRHDRSLDELVQDYLRYLEIGKGNAGWTAHNKMMIRNACEGVAATKGWEYVQSFPWWSEVMPVFGLDAPWEQKEQAPVRKGRKTTKA